MINLTVCLDEWNHNKVFYEIKLDNPDCLQFKCENLRFERNAKTEISLVIALINEEI